ncbi:hypothetical protein E2N92_06760 [Methanofollis formosanus]|uniref:Uncharacterized protein n=1 Tax=Methanofollis formosanus TaxID=299308 RepID=A0A8G1EFU9_9EURY|nr:hypothetical protein [Methanofollis formosanus]QYZ79153.1 hypothetical protein E2N92_06760 [Methanofollis formosanus]
MDKPPLRRGKIFILVAVVLVAVVIVSVLLIDQNREAQIEEQKEAIRHVIPGISENDLDSLLSRQVYAAYGQIRKGQNLPVTLKAADADLEDQHFFYPDGPVFGYGINYLGCIMIFLDENASADRETIDEIYQIIESHANATGTGNTPVLFVRAPQIQPDMETA